MRYLIYNCSYVTPHLETEMEIALKAQQEGHEIFFFRCQSELKTCFVNPEHKVSACFVCRSKTHNAIKALDLPADHVFSFSQFKITGLNDEYTFPSISKLKEFKYKGSDIGFAVASSIISRFRDHQLDTIKYKDEIQKSIVSAIMVHDVGEQLLDKVQPDVVIMFNGRFLEYRPFMRLCEKRDIDFYTHERGGKIDRYMLRKNSTPHSIAFAKNEMEQMWQNAGPEKVTIGENFFKDRRNKVVQSWSVFTEEQKDGVLPVGFDRSKKNICFFNSSMDEYEGIPDFNNPLYADDNEGIKQICDSFINRPEYHFYLRVHPNLKGLDNAQNKAIANLKKSCLNLTIIEAYEEIDTYALMEAADMVVTFGSTIGIESLYWKKPSLLLGKAFYEDLEGIIKPASHEEAVRFIIDPPVINSNNSALKYGYWSITFGVPFKHFTADGLFSGEFMGKRIEASVVSKIRSKVQRILNEN